jgi:hypothetical protein
MKPSQKIKRLENKVTKQNKEIKELKIEDAECSKEIMALQKISIAWQNQLPELYIKAINVEFDKFNKRRKK